MFSGVINPFIRLKSSFAVAALILALGCDSTTTPPEVDTFPPTPHVINAGLAIAGGAIAGTPDGGMVAWSYSGLFGVSRYSREGAQLWTAPTFPCQEIQCSLAVDASGDVYVPAGELIALSASGTLKWRSREITGGSVAIGSDNRLFGLARGFPFSSPAVVSLDKGTGAVVWRDSLQSFVATSIFLDEGRSTVYATGAGGIVALNSVTGSERWRAVFTSCDKAAIGSAGEIYSVCESAIGRRLYAINPDGSTRWANTLTWFSGYSLSPVIDRNGRVIVAGSGGISAFTSSGNLVWAYSVSDDAGLIAFSDPVIDAEGNLYVVERLNRVNAPAITAFRDGERIGKVVDVQDPHGRSLLMTRDGRIFYDANGRIVYFDSKGFDASNPWPMNRGSPDRAARR